MTPYGLQRIREHYQHLRRGPQPAISEGAKVTTTATAAVSILRKPAAISAMEFHRKCTATLRLKRRSIVPALSNKSSHRCASRRTFPVAAASCCRPPALWPDRICGNGNRQPIARSGRPPACRSAYRESATKSTARCNRLRNQDDNSGQSCFIMFSRFLRNSLVILQFVQQINEPGDTHRCLQRNA